MEIIEQPALRLSYVQAKSTLRSIAV